jgi:ABC-type multidrug transport system ATPase subunit
MSTGRLSLAGVTFSFDRGIPVLRDVDLVAEPGSVTVVHGANGSGKTTLLRLAAGILRPGGGAVRRSRHVRYQPQAADDPPPSVTSAAWLTAMARMSGARDAAPSLQLLEQLGVRRDLPLDEASRGTVSKVLIAAALGGPAGLVVLDEPFAALDTVARDAVAGMVRDAARDGAAVVLTMHSDGIDVGATTTVRVEEGRLVAVPPPTRADLGSGDAVGDGSGSGTWRVVVRPSGGPPEESVVDGHGRDALLRSAFEAGAEVLHVERLS